MIHTTDINPIKVRTYSCLQGQQIVYNAEVNKTGREGPEGCETSRLPHFLDNWLTDGSEVVSLSTSRPLRPGRFLVLISVRG
jgi:hypothetical protein